MLLPRKKKHQKQKKKLKGIKERREEMKKFIAQQLEKVEPLRGMAFVGLTVSIYHGQNELYNRMEQFMGLFGITERYNVPEAEALVSEMGLIAICPACYPVIKAGESLVEAIAYMPKTSTEWALETAKWAYKTQKTAGVPDEQAVEWALLYTALQVRFVRICLAMGAAWCLMSFFQQVTWDKIVEAVPGFSIMGTGMTQ